jgi:histidyl-tRNA synthetase
MKYSAPRGTYDILPEETPIWQAVEKTCRRLFAIYNYKEIRTPIFEPTELFFRSIGETTDIVSKEMYTFTDRKGRSLTLRPEETAPVVRACLENNLISKDQITKLYYLGPMFRYERPQAGRQRQFHQAGVEVFGSDDPRLDVEAIVLAEQIFNRLGLLDLEVDLNSVGCGKCRPEFIKKLKAYFKSDIKKMCEECQKRLEANPLRILDCKEGPCQNYIEKAPAAMDTICADCKSHFKAVLAGVESVGLKYKINNRLVRGLDYYTRTTFEVVSRQLGAQNALCGGGRYDTLVEELGGKPTPAMGFAIGLERLIKVLEAQKPDTVSRKKMLSVYIATLGEEARRVGFDILDKLRRAGISADMDFIGKSLKAQMKAADREETRQVLIIGEDELKSGKAILRNMKTASQEEIACDARIIVEKLQPLR